jgi:hypothetical protein
VVGVGEQAVDISGLDSDEASVVGEYRWWALDDIASSNELFSPARFADLIAPVLEGSPPRTPVEISE